MEEGDKVFKPHPRLIHKKNLMAFIYTIIGGGIVFLVAYFDEDRKVILDYWYILMAILGGIFLIWTIYNILLFRTIVYTLEENEIKSKRGILHKRERIVPFHAVTNMSIARDPIDRIFGIGTVKLHTAGFSGEKTPEGKIEGVRNYTHVYNILSRKTKTPSEIITEEYSSQDLANYQVRLIETRKAILKEFIEIKELFEKKRKT